MRVIPGRPSKLVSAPGSWAASTPGRSVARWPASAARSGCFRKRRQSDGAFRRRWELPSPWPSLRSDGDSDPTIHQSACHGVFTLWTLVWMRLSVSGPGGTPNNRGRGRPGSRHLALRTQVGRRIPRELHKRGPLLYHAYMAAQTPAIGVEGGFGHSMSMTCKPRSMGIGLTDEGYKASASRG